LLLVLLLLAWPAAALAEHQTASPSTAVAEVENLVGKAEVLEDGSARLTIDEVSLSALRQRFVPLEPARVNVGYTRAAYWLRFTLQTPLPALRYLEVYQGVDDARLFRRLPSGEWQEQRLGRSLPFHSRTIAHKNFYFPLSLPGGTATDYYLRLQTADTLQLQLRLLSPAALTSTVAMSRLIAGLYLGTIAALSLYNFLLFLWLRDRAYLYYVFFQLALASLQASLDQITFQFLWPHHPLWSAQSELFFVGLAIFGGAAFARHFLSSAHNPAPLASVLVVIQWLALGLALLFPFTASVTYLSVAMVFVGASCSLLLLAGIVSWLRRSPNAPFFVVAWGILLAGTVVASLTALGLLPMVGIAQETTRVGSAVEAVLLSLGLAHRINRMRQENQSIQADLLRIRTEEAEALELRVKDRTRELESALAELRTTQGRLVQQARLASLGHLVTGIVHEVGNPLNFIHGGSEDLTYRLERLRDQLGKRPGSSSNEGLANDARESIAGAATAAELIASGNRRIRQIIENLRSLVSARPLAIEPTNVGEVIRTTVALMAPKLHAQGIEIELSLEETPEIPCRAGEFGQVVMNLVLNSSQAMTSGGGIWIEARHTDATIEVTVRDNGPGIPPSVRDAIFDPFFTTRPPNEGTGLGLSICHEIIARQGGTLRLMASGPGATFLISLPTN